jgi:outer membrane protein assembly factor BamB
MHSVAIYLTLGCTVVAVGCIPPASRPPQVLYSQTTGSSSTGSQTTTGNDSLTTNPFERPRDDAGASTTGTKKEPGSIIPQGNGAPADSWPVFRGDIYSTGVSSSQLPDELELIWETEFEESGFEGAAVIDDGVVYTADSYGEVRAQQLGTGELIWQASTPLGFIATPAIRDGKLFVGDLDGIFYCYDAKAGGDPLWTFESMAEIDSGANFYGDKVLFGSQDATLYCLDADTGEVAWKHQIDDQIRCTPTVVEDRCFVAGCDGRLHIIDLKKGEASGGVEIQSPAGVTPAVQGDYVYFGTEAGVFFGVNWREAETAWTFEDPRAAQGFRSSAAVKGDLVVVGGRDRRLRAFDTISGEQVWQLPVKSRIDCSPVICGERVYFGAGDGRLYAVDLKSGESVWEHEVKGGFVASAAIASGRLVIGSDEGVLYCFGKKDEE